MHKQTDSIRTEQLYLLKSNPGKDLFASQFCCRLLYELDFRVLKAQWSIWQWANNLLVATIFKHQIRDGCHDQIIKRPSGNSLLIQPFLSERYRQLQYQRSVNCYSAACSREMGALHRRCWRLIFIVYGTAITTGSPRESGNGRIWRAGWSAWSVLNFHRANRCLLHWMSG